MHYPARNSTLHLRIALPGSVVILGAAVRFMQMGLIRFGYDQSYPAFQALGLLDAGVWPLIGQPSSVFLDNPALMPYIQALPLLLVRSPLAVQGFILVINSIAVWFVWRVATDLLGRRAGWIAAFLFAINPWVVFFSRTTWVQSLVPFFMAAVAWGLWPAFVEARAEPRRFFAGFVVVTLLTQTYIQAWGVLPQIGVLLLLSWRRLPRRALTVAVAVFAVAAALYAIGLATRADANATKAGGFLIEGWQGLTSIGLRHAVRFVNGIDFRATHAAGNPAAPAWATLSTLAMGLLSLALLAGVVRAAVALRQKGRERRLATVLLVWFFVPVVLTSVQGTFDIHPHYLLLTLPAGQLLAAWGVAPLWRGRARLLVAALLAAVGLIFVHDLYRANELVGRQPTMPKFDGWSLSAGSQLGRAMRDVLLETAGPFPRRIVADGNKELLSGLSATYVQPVQEVSFPDFTLLATEPIVYVFEGEQLPAWLQPYFDPDSLRTVAIGDSAIFSVAGTLPAPEATPADQRIERVELTSEAGLTLAGYELAAPGPDGTRELITYWRVDELHPQRGEWYVAPSYHVVDSAGNIVANVGEHGQWGYRWELGDVYVERVAIPAPADGEYTLEVGLFDSLRGVPYTLFDEGAAVGSYTLPLVENNE